MGQLAEASSAFQVTPHLSQGPPAILCLAAAPGEWVDNFPGNCLREGPCPLLLTSHSPLFPSSTLSAPPPWPSSGLPFPRELVLGPLQWALQGLPLPAAHTGSCPHPREPFPPPQGHLLPVVLPPLGLEGGVGGGCLSLHSRGGGGRESENFS